jgi:hypothetical protein
VPPRAISVPLALPRQGINSDDLSEDEKKPWEATDWGDDVGEDEIPDSVQVEAVGLHPLRGGDVLGAVDLAGPPELGAVSSGSSPFEGSAPVSNGYSFSRNTDPRCVCRLVDRWRRRGSVADPASTSRSSKPRPGRRASRLRRPGSWMLAV